MANAWAVNNPNTADGTQVLTFTAVTIGANVGDYFEMDVEAYSGNTGDAYRVASIGSAFDGLLEVGSSNVIFRPNNFNTLTFNANYTQPPVGQRFTVKVERISTGVWEIFIDGASIGTATNSLNFPVAEMMNIQPSGGNGFLGKLYTAEASSSGGTPTNRWVNRSGPTGSVLVDEIAGNNATLVDFATDGSQWALYDDGTATPPSIINVDTDKPLVDGQQDVAFTVAYFGGDIISASLEVGASAIVLTGVTGTGNSGTFDLMDVTTLSSGTAGLPFSSATYQNAIKLSDGTDTASINITRNPKAGWAIVETASAVSTEGSIFEGRTGGAPSDASQIYYPTTGNTSISVTGIITTDLETAINGFVWDVTSGEWETFTFTAADDVAPVITVSGNASTTIAYQGTAPTFTATASDARDGDITNDIVVSGDTVDVNTAGTYVIRYNVSDAAGNAATEVTRTVIVSADAVSPVINVSGNATTTIAFGATVPTFTATVTDNSGESITPVLSGDTVDNQTAGTYVLRWNATDSAGNAATEVTRTVIVQAEVDTQAPVITVSGQPTTTIDFGGTAPTFTSSADDGSTVVVSGDTVDVNTAGTYVIRFNATDAAGNQATEVTRTVIVQNEVDTQAPVITVTGDATTTIAYGATVPTFTATTDDGSTVVVGGDTVDNQTAGTYVITFNATDSAGNQATQVTRTVIVQAEVISSTATFTVTGTPDADYTVDFHNPTTGALIRRVADVTFTDGEASVVLSDVAVGTSYRAVVFTSTHLFGNVGVTA